MDKDLIKMRDLFRESADIIDELIDLQAKEVAGRDVKKEIESTYGRFVYKMMELQSLSD